MPDDELADALENIRETNPRFRKTLREAAARLRAAPEGERIHGWVFPNDLDLIVSPEKTDERQVVVATILHGEKGESP